jgi:co-chaperonin GroES (HSP10)
MKLQEEGFPVLPLWLKEGRMTIEVMKIKGKTKSGIDLEEDQTIFLRTGKIVALTENLVREYGLKVGDYVLFNMLSGGVVKIDFNKVEGKLLSFLHGMDVFGVWTTDPVAYYQGGVVPGNLSDTIVTEKPAEIPEGFSSDPIGMQIIKE